MKKHFIIVAVVALSIGSFGSLREARGQGLLQVTFDRDAWPTEEVQRTIVIPLDMTQLQLTAGLFSLSNHDGPFGDSASVTQYAITPMMEYGVTPNISIGATYDLGIVSSGDGMGNSNTDTNLSAGSVFAIARPFNSYDLGIEVGIPFVLSGPTNIDVELQLVGRLVMSLDRVALFFNSGIVANAYSGSQTTATGMMVTVDEPTEFLANAYLACQLNTQLSLAPGMTFTHAGDFDALAVYGRVQFAIDHQFDVFGIIGYQVGDERGTLVTLGANMWL